MLLSRCMADGARSAEETCRAHIFFSFLFVHCAVRAAVCVWPRTYIAKEHRLIDFTRLSSCRLQLWKKSVSAWLEVAIWSPDCLGSSENTILRGVSSTVEGSSRSVVGRDTSGDHLLPFCDVSDCFRNMYKRRGRSLVLVRGSSGSVKKLPGRNWVNISESRG